MLLAELMDTSVQVGQVLIPARSVESFLGGFAQHLVVWNHDEVFKISLIGSCSPVKYRERYFVLCTKHQIDGVNPPDLCLLRSDGSSAVTSNGVRYWSLPEYSKDTDAYDLVILDFTEACEAEADLRSLFFAFDSVPPNTTNEQVVALVGAGYPSSEQVYEIHENNHLGSVRRVFLLKPDGQPIDDAVLRGRTYAPTEFAADGLSGGPVFVVQLLGQVATAYFAGIIQRGGGGYIHFLKSGLIKRALDATIDAQA